jgi:hypothetical protein
MGTREEKDEMEGVESISPEQAKKEMLEAAQRAMQHEEEGKHTRSSKQRSTTSKRRDTARKDEMEDVETISPEQAKKEMLEAAQRAKQLEQKKKK